MPDPRDGDSALNDVDQQVFYEILQNTAKTAEEVHGLRRDIIAVMDSTEKLDDRVTANELTVGKHELRWHLLGVVFTLLLAATFTYIFTLL